MNIVNQASIDSLISHSAGTAISLYLPTHRHPTPPHIQEDQIRYKNLIAEVHDESKRKHIGHDMDTVFKQLEDKLNDLDFWKQTTEGMAIFASLDRFEVYHLPIETDEKFSVGDSFDVAPLLAVISLDQPYYLLAVALHDSKLFRGDICGLVEADIELPHSVEAALNIDEMFANSRTVKSHEGPGGAKGSVSPHGEGDSQEAGKQERQMYYRIIDKTIMDWKSYNPKIPVLVAGTDSEAGDFRATSRLPNILDTYLQGNHTKTPINELHELAWPLVRDELKSEQHGQIVDRFNELQGVGKSSSDMGDIADAADKGRVDTLLVDLLHITNDSISDSRQGPIMKLVFDRTYATSKISELVKKVYNQGGNVIGLDSNSMPNQSSVSAIYRY